MSFEINRKRQFHALRVKSPSVLNDHIIRRDCLFFPEFRDPPGVGIEMFTSFWKSFLSEGPDLRVKVKYCNLCNCIQNIIVYYTKQLNTLIVCLFI